ncbi:UbiA prenyltransferase family protein [Thermoproteota archaeon]
MLANVKDFIRLLRFRSWIGWLAIFGVGSFIFGLPQIFDVLVVAFVFSCITSAIFVENQYFDKETDQKNPKKNMLPLATKKVSPKTSLLIMLILCGLGFITLTFFNPYLIPIFLAYFTLCSVYSTPILHLKGKPILDLIVAGVGSGVFPFLIGLLVANQLSLDIHLPWVARSYQDAFLCILPLFLFQVASQIFQELRDVQADMDDEIQTFVVRYGIKQSTRVATIMVFLAISLPVIFGFLNLSYTNEFVLWYILVLIIISPILVRFVSLNKKPTKEKIEDLFNFSMKYTPVILIILFTYILVLRIYLP